MKTRWTLKKIIGNYRSMLTCGLGKNCIYAYSGLLTKTGQSIGASIGTKGIQLYTCIKRAGYKLKIKWNAKDIFPTLKLTKSKKCIPRQNKNW